MGRITAVTLLGLAFVSVTTPVLAQTVDTTVQASGSATAAMPLPISRSAEGYASERGAASRRSPDLLEVPEPPGELPAPEKGDPSLARKHALLCCEFRIFDARVWLYDDRDGDGYFTYFRVSFDVDTDFAQADVYARLFLRGADGVWNFFYETEVFPIFGSSGSDEYEVETELVSGYPTGAYDLLIKVYDADYGDLVVQYGPHDTSALSVTPLEDLTYDGLPPPPVTISRGSSGGGAMFLELLGLLIAAGFMARRPRRAPAGSPWRRE